MKTSRLDNVLRRNRKSTVLDLALVAFMLVALLFTGLAFGEQVSNLGPAPVAATTDAADSDATVVAADRPTVRLARR